MRRYVAMAFIVGITCTPSTFLFDLSKLIFFNFFNFTEIGNYAGVRMTNTSDDFIASCFLLPLAMVLVVNLVIHFLGICV